MERKQGPRLSPRIKAQLNQQDKPLVSQAEGKPLSTTEVQEEAVLDPISGGLEGSKHPQNCDKLDTETSEKSPNLDTENEPFVSSEDGCDDIPDAVFEPLTQIEAENEIEAAEKRKSQADLAEILRESAEGGIPVEMCGLEPTTYETYGGIDRTAEPEVLARAMPEAEPGLLGHQPDGSYTLLVSVPEEYVSGVLSAAESAERTPNQWGSENFLFFLEGYFQPQKGR